MDFDELYVVSDLHMGGEPGFQILNQGDTLSTLIRELSSKDEGSSLGLVLNGDVVDFLAEQPPTYLDTKGAIGKLKRIIADPAFSSAFIYN